MQRIVIFTSRAMLVFLILSVLTLRHKPNRSTFSAVIPNKEGKTCYAVKGALNNSIYHGSRLDSGVEAYIVEAWNTDSFNEGKCDPGQKVTIKQYMVESKFDPVEQKLRFQVYQSGTLAHKEIWHISSDRKTNYRLSAYSNHELGLIDPEVEFPSLGEIATN